MNTSMIKKIVFALILVLILISGFFLFLKSQNKKETNAPQENTVQNDSQDKVENEEKKDIQENENNESGTNIKEVKDNGEEKIPDKFLIKVPFTSQAPFAVWDELHEEACEEASIVMVKYFLDKKELTPQVAENEIQDLVKFQIKKYGDYRDTNAEQTMKMFVDFYGQPKNGLRFEVIYDFKKEDLKEYLSKGNPIIVPAAGRLLGNPNFTPPGPLYHNLVLVGYEGNKIITNDPGTKRGQNYKYDIDLLYKAIHDFPGKKEDIEKGDKAMIVLE